MAERMVDVVLVEMLDAINGIETHTTGKTIEDFEREWLLKLAIQRALEIISEASRHIPNDLFAIAPDVPWKQIRGVGNVLRHEYHKVADDLIWAVVTEHIAPLKNAVQSILDSLEETRA